MDDDLLSALRKIVEDRSKEPAKRDVELLLSNGITTYESLCRVLGDPDLDLDFRLAACWVLAQVNVPIAEAALLRALGDKEPQLSFEAAKSLVALGNEASIPRVINMMLSGDNPHNRAAAAYVLGMLASKSALGSLIDVLGGDDVPEVRSHAAEALGSIGDKRAIDSLITSLGDPSHELRYWSSFALGEIGDRRAIPELERLASNDHAVLSSGESVSREALNAIKRIRETALDPPDPE